MQRDNPVVQAFYQSVAWKKCRRNYYLSQYGICERCKGVGRIVHHKKHVTIENVNDDNITLNFDNLELLCQDCHNKEHMSKVTYMFDENGNLIKK